MTGDSNLTRFTELFLRTARSALERYAPATAQKNINLATLAAVAVPLPPISEQRRILALVDLLLAGQERAETTASHCSERSAALRQAILRTAFEGGLVSQDPDDEPASALIEGIHRDRDSNHLQTKRGRKPKPDQQAVDL